MPNVYCSYRCQRLNFPQVSLFFSSLLLLDFPRDFLNKSYNFFSCNALLYGNYIEEAINVGEVFYSPMISSLFFSEPVPLGCNLHKCVSIPSPKAFRDIERLNRNGAECFEWPHIEGWSRLLLDIALPQG